MKKIIKPFIVCAIVVLMTVPQLGALAAAKELVPVGSTVGIDLQSDGVLVVGLSEVETISGKTSPAAECGMERGDVITRVNSTQISSAEEFKAVMKKLDGKTISITVDRKGKTYQLALTPAKNKNGAYELGVWLRDGISGIGTVTFYDPETGLFGALGHAVSDVDTGIVIPVKDGSITPSKVVAVIKGKCGCPGELQGVFEKEKTIGRIFENTENGIFGKAGCGAFSGCGAALPVAKHSEVTVGEASILSNIKGDAVKEFKAEIIKIYSENSGHDLMIKINDAALLEETGGIVQGMSGSPILQNGKLVGAVTHVLLNDPERGYGVFVENMLCAAQSVIQDAA